MMSGAVMPADPHIAARLAVLAAAAGAVDAASFLGLDQVFTANQTGNTVLLGIAIGVGDGDAVLRTGVSVAAFAAGVMLGARALRGATAGWSAPTGRILLVQAGLLAVAAALWAPLDTAALIAIVAAAMGVQSAAALRVGVPGVSTTYVTGTLTRMAARLVDPRAGPREVAPPLAWLAYLAGAIAGGLLSRWTDGGATVAVGAAVVVAAALPVPRKRRRGSS
jgi:uncharacterized membrane protein YoaK (UPF0700 family)